MYNPAHPGEVLSGLILKPEKITMGTLAEALGVSRKFVSDLVHGRANIDAELAVKLGKALGTTPEIWLGMQRDYDLWQAKQKVDLSSVKALLQPKPLAEAAA